jgi:hypothetical protein
LISENFTKTYAPWATWIIVVASLLAGYVQYRQFRRDQTVSRVFDMSKEYRANFLDVRLTFADEWSDYRESLHKLSPVYVMCHYSELVETFLKMPGTEKTPGPRKEYESLGFFYNSLGECVKATLCDFDSANVMFGDDVLAYYHNMYPALMSVKSEGTEADGIFDFADKVKKARPKGTSRRLVMPRCER